MLEHADGDDAVERPLDVAVVLQAEFGALGEAGLGARAARRPRCSCDKVTPVALRPGDLREIERHAAEAAADVEHRVPLVDQQLGRDMTLLGELRFFEALPGPLEIGARILPVGVEEEVDRAGDPDRNGGRCSRARAPYRCADGSGAPRCAPCPNRRPSFSPAQPTEFARAELEKIIEVAVRQFEPAVHVKFARAPVRDRASIRARRRGRRSGWLVAARSGRRKSARLPSQVSTSRWPWRISLVRKNARN